MRKKIEVTVKKPQFSVTTDVSFAQVDAWYGHTRMDLKMDIIYPEDDTRLYPCVVWVCSGAWMKMDKSAHLAYLSRLARKGFVVASVQYRTSNEEPFPAALEDVKAGIRYLRAYADRYHIDKKHIGISGESAGGHLASLAALATDKKFDVGAYLEESSALQAACPWYPVVDLTTMPGMDNEAEAALTWETMFLGKNVYNFKKDAMKLSPLHYVTKTAPPFLIIHGNDDKCVPFEQGVRLHDALEEAGCDVTLLEVDGADHADLRFFQKEIWDNMIAFFKEKLSND